MTTDLDTLATALCAVTDDMLKESPHLAPLRPAVGMSPQLSDAELVTLAVLQAPLGFTSEARWVRHVKASLGHLFPYVPQQSGCLVARPLPLRFPARLRAPEARVFSLVGQSLVPPSLLSPKTRARASARRGSSLPPQSAGRGARFGSRSVLPAPRLQSTTM